MSTETGKVKPFDPLTEWTINKTEDKNMSKLFINERHLYYLQKM